MTRNYAAAFPLSRFRRGRRRLGTKLTWKAAFLRTSLNTLVVTLTPLLIRSEVYTFCVVEPKPPITQGFKMGEGSRPDGSKLSLDSSSLLIDGSRWMPVMGEFHYSRYPESEWREELLKMKAGGVDVVSTYVFWIHHEEEEGHFDWSGNRNLRHYVQLCGELGLKSIVRCGPWDHGEVRNGGFPDWLEAKGWKTHSDDTNYLAKVKVLYGKIASQLSGLLWKDGGPVIGIQLENEYGGAARHLLTLKRLAREAGLDVPLYTRTGWPRMATPMPFGELVPLYGVYAEGFWDRELTSMPGNVYWKGFQFSALRTEGAFGTDLPGEHIGKDYSDTAAYPYLSCEIGAGMMSSYHRRILVNPLDSLSTTLVKLGSGGASLGYYMYHGGENPDGRLSTLMESQATGMWNDMPVKNYDFQTALGQYGQIRPQYHMLRRLHLFLHEWGSRLAAMPAVMPEQRPHGRKDLNTLRCSVRSDGKSGFVFVNNYQRSQKLGDKPEAQFSINLPGAHLQFPAVPVTVPADACFVWPFNLRLAPDIKIRWATAEPITAVEEGTRKTVFFAALNGVPASFAFDKNVKITTLSGEIEASSEETVVRNLTPGPHSPLQLNTGDGHQVRIVVLNEADSLCLWKARWQGQDRIFLTRAGLVADQSQLRLTSSEPGDLSLCIFPAPEAIDAGGHAVNHKTDGIFERFIPPCPSTVDWKVHLESIQPADPPREIPLGRIDQPVAAAPLDQDFEKAAKWRVALPSGLDLSLDPLLRLHYSGDVARVSLNGKLVTDDFYNGNVFEIGLKRYAPQIQEGNLEIAILPLRKDAPIFMADKARPDFGTGNSIVSLQSVELVPRYQVQLTPHALNAASAAQNP